MEQMNQIRHPITELQRPVAINHSSARRVIAPDFMSGLTQLTLCTYHPDISDICVYLGHNTS